MYSGYFRVSPLAVRLVFIFPSVLIIITYLFILYSYPFVFSFMVDVLYILIEWS